MKVYQRNWSRIATHHHPSSSSSSSSSSFFFFFFGDALQKSLRAYFHYGYALRCVERDIEMPIVFLLLSPRNATRNRKENTAENSAFQSDRDRDEIWQNCSSSKNSHWLTESNSDYDVILLRLAATTRFHAEKCYHLISTHTTSARRVCSSIRQFHFLIHSATFVLVKVGSYVIWWLTFYHSCSARSLRK